MVRGRNDEVARPLALQWPDVAEGRQLIIAGELVFRILVDVQLFALLTAFHEVTFDEHLDLQAQVIVV